LIEVILDRRIRFPICSSRSQATLLTLH